MTKRNIFRFSICILIIFMLVYDQFRDGEWLYATCSLFYFLVLMIFVFYKVPEGPFSGWPYWMTTGQIWLAWFGEVSSVVVCVSVLHGVGLDNWWMHLIYLPLCFGGAWLFRYAYTKNGPKDHSTRYVDPLDAHPYVVVAEFGEVESARVVRDMLKDNGIEAITYNEVIPSYIDRKDKPVQVCVRKSDKMIAENLINS